MRSQAARLAVVAVAWIALGAAGFFVFTSHQHILTSAAGIRSVDLHAREAGDALVDLRVAQQAYVASGQGVAFWMPKVAATRDSVVAALAALRQSTASASAQAAVDEGSSAIGEFADVDKRARDYVRSGQLLMASDVIFTEGGQLITVAARQVETARLAEHEAFDASEASVRQQEAAAIGVAGALAGLIALVLAATGPRSTDAAQASPAGTLSLGRVAPLGEVSAVSPVSPVSPVGRLGNDGEEGIVSHARAGAPTSHRPPTAAPARNAVMLRAVADLATDLGRLRDSEELERLLGRAADLIDADGLVVWMGSGPGSSSDALRPVLAYGYAPHIVARMPSVPRSADNAAAGAYRTGALQIVRSRPGGSAGAIVAPILGPNGCIGALSAEIKSGGEESEAVQAVASIVAAHLAGVLALAPVEAGAPEARAAAQ
jgi:hypothetical protein